MNEANSFLLKDIYIIMYLLNPSTMSKMWHKAIFKQNTTGLNSEFSFFTTGCQTKLKNKVFPTIYP